MTALGARTLDTKEQRPAILRVERSARGVRWIERLMPGQENLAQTIAQQENVPEIVARVLAARGATPDTLAEYLNPTLKALMPDPSSLRDMDTAAARFAQAIRDKEPVAIFGDYDVDGASSVALIRRFLAAHNLRAPFYIPDRAIEGYGPNVTAFEQLISEGAKLIIAVDCGTAAYEPLARAHELGADVIVLDHHQANEELPQTLALVNPNRLDDISGQGDLAAAGVVYLFLVATARELRRADWYGDDAPHPDLMQLLDLVALATVCDVVPLTGVNRAFVARGLEVLRNRQNTGLRVLADAAGLAAAPTPYHLGYVLGPRLNAGGRIGRADLAAELLFLDDELRADEIAAVLDRLNAERRAMQESLQEEALAQADAAFAAHPDAPLVMAEGEGWHKGVIGLIAARLSERYARPACVVTWDENGTGAGSARSIPGADIGAAIRGAVEAGHLARGGGHPMAAGFTLSRAQARGFASYMEDRLRAQVSEARIDATLKIDGALMASSATPEFMALLDQAGPFGAGNPQPRFAFAAHRCTFAKVVGDNHVRCSLTASDGARIDAVAFNSADTNVGRIILDTAGLPLHAAGHLRRSNWGGREKVELHIEDVATPGG